MAQDFISIIMNPVRQRIIQYLLLHGTGTASKMQEELLDIPPASLYRHIKVLLENNCLEIVEERKIRGTVERTYAVHKSPVGEYRKDAAGKMIQTALMSLLTSFGRYFAREDSDPVKDMLALSTSTLLLSDEEFMLLTKKIGEELSPYLGNQAQEGRKARRLTIIFSPCEEE